MVKGGIPSFKLPAFTAKSGNETIEFMEILGDLSTGLVFLPLVAVLANVAIAKAFSE
jgi:sodium-independent sulfate anion transporter 11